MGEPDSGCTAEPKCCPSVPAASEALAASDTSAPSASPQGSSSSPSQWQSPQPIAPLDVEPQLLVIAGPSGVGKGTLVKRLRQNWPAAFAFSVSHTTRKPRPGEEEGREYFFVSREQMDIQTARGDFIEHAEFSGNKYGTSIAEVQRIASLGKICLLEIDLVGVNTVRARNFKSARFVFIEPPSFAELERRLRKRNTETPEVLERRLQRAQEELQAAQQMSWDLQLVNDTEEEAWKELRDAVGRWFCLPLETKE